VLALVASSASVAQEGAAPDENADSIAEVLVTGSRIVDSNIKSPSPVTTLTERALELVASSNVEEAVNQLPQVTPRETAGNDLNGQGIATINLRGLGASRTLTLVNGRRLVPTTTRGAVDINNLPANLVERIEIVSGGASAVYGSDALAGVVNFILKDDFEGFEIEGRYGESRYGDGDKFDLNASLGASLAEGRGNVTLFGSYTDRAQSLQADRQLHRVNANGGSSTVPAGRIENSAFNPNPTATQFLGSGGTTRVFVFEQNGNLDPFVNALPQVDPAGDRYNFNPANLLQSPQQRLAVGGLGHFRLGDGLDVRLEMLYADNRTAVQFAESPLTNAILSPTNPMLSAEAQAMLAQRPDPAANAIFSKRLTALGPRRRDFDSDLYQATLVFEGSMGEDWKWEAFASAGRTEVQSVVTGGASQSRINASLLGCPAGTATFGCRVIDFFGDKPLSAADIAWIEQTAVDVLTFDRESAGGFASGPLFNLPAGAVQTALGVEYREDSSRSIPSDAARRGDLAGFATVQETGGSFDVGEVFGELQVPLLADRSLARSLALDLGVRYSDYSSVGGVTTYKSGITWEVLDGVRLRSMFQKATRAPSVFELFQAGDRVFVNFSDPCARVTPTGAARPAPSDAVAQVCILQGAPDPRLDPTFTQINLTIDVDQIGNTGLLEESSDTFTVGLVHEPQFLQRAAVSLDYFSVEVDDYIGRAFGGINGIINACFSSGVSTIAAYNADPACSQLRRDSAATLLGLEPFANSGTLKTTGLDLGLQFGFDMERFGKLDFNVSATYTDEYVFNGTDYVGLTSQNFGTLPDLRAFGRSTWTLGGATMSLAWQRINGGTEEISRQDIPSVDYFDLGGRYAFGGGSEVYVGVNNVLDEDPPLIRNQLNNTDVHTYELLGRYYYAGLKLRF
jgi:outer membrane receptor protein involved in Fe transport